MTLLPTIARRECARFSTSARRVSQESNSLQDARNTTGNAARCGSRVGEGTIIVLGSRLAAQGLSAAAKTIAAR